MERICGRCGVADALLECAVASTLCAAVGAEARHCCTCVLLALNPNSSVYDHVYDIAKGWLHIGLNLIAGLQWDC